MKNGTNISKTQERLLFQARTPSRLSSEAFSRIADDDDIRSGEEELHPDWRDLYDSKRETVRSRYSVSAFEKIDEFFQALSVTDASLNELDVRALKTPSCLVQVLPSQLPPISPQ